MSTASSPEDVCNLSFDLLRHSEKVENIEEPESDAESLAARWYDVIRRATLRAFPWNFAKTRTTLSLNSTAPAFGYSDAYNLPNDYMELVFVGENYDEDYEMDYAVEGNQLLINNSGAASLQICYIRDVTEVVYFDPCFVNLLIGELAVVFANSLTGINKGMKEVTTWRDRAEAKARTKNGQENPVKRRDRSEVLANRRALSSGNGHDGSHLFRQ